MLATKPTRAEPNSIYRAIKVNLSSVLSGPLNLSAQQKFLVEPLVLTDGNLHAVSTLALPVSF